MRPGCVQLLGYADRAAVIEHEGEFAGFVITIRPATAYDSVNYRWFADSYDSFGYLDRIVLAPACRRLGLGGRVYDEIEHASAPLGRLALEVNIDPPNEPSLAFHRQRGYRQVGEQLANGHRVGLMIKELR